MEITGFQHQVGGHFGILQCAGHVVKPLNSREMAFYELMSDNIRQFTPEYCGRVRVCARQDKHGHLRLFTDSPLPCHSEAITYSKNDDNPMCFRMGKCGRVEVEEGRPNNQWAVTCQSKVVEKLLEGAYSWFILLENVVASYSRPCILDLKIGTRQHGDDASETKRRRQLRKCRESTSEALGVRMVGMQLYDDKIKNYSFVDKFEGRKIDPSQFRSHMQKYVRQAGKARASRMRQRLRALRSALLQSEGYRFFSASILVAFDADAPDSSNEDGLRVMLIDFAHSTYPGFYEDIVYDGHDDGCIKGIDSILSATDLKMTLASSPPVATVLPEERAAAPPPPVEETERPIILEEVDLKAI